MPHVGRICKFGVTFSPATGVDGARKTDSEFLGWTDLDGLDTERRGERSIRVCMAAGESRSGEGVLYPSH